MNNEKFTIVIPTHSNYLDVCDNFLSVLRLSWRDCPYPVVVSVCGKDTPLQQEVKKLYNGPKATLLDCVVNAAKNYPSQRYIVLLGDAFMCGKVEQKNVERLLSQLCEHRIDYCSLCPKRPMYKEKKITDMFRQICVMDRYNHSFICFIASGDFLQREFVESGIRTDMDFEMKYLEQVNTAQKPYYHDAHAILTEDVFHIRPGIEKGKWDRRVLSWLKRNYGEIEYANRPKLHLWQQVYSDVLSACLPLVSNKTRRTLKKIVGKLTKNKIYTTNT